MLTLTLTLTLETFVVVAGYNNKLTFYFFTFLWTGFWQVDFSLNFLTRCCSKRQKHFSSFGQTQL